MIKELSQIKEEKKFEGIVTYDLLSDRNQIL